MMQKSSTTNQVLFAVALVMMGLLLAAFVALDQKNWIVVGVELVVCVVVFFLVGFLGLGIAELFVALVALLILQISDHETGATLKILIFYLQVGSALLSKSLLGNLWVVVREKMSLINLQLEGLECYGLGNGSEAMMFLFKMMLPLMLICFCGLVLLAKEAVKKWKDRCKAKRKMRQRMKIMQNEDDDVGSLLEQGQEDQQGKSLKDTLAETAL